ncbi:hypothetical protein CBR_g48675 [Chara braunii]|uniref:non-specific serine/threonine protein kinase n=1 Tax=Chara braunii TaxID=69332 RepID=A0A388K4F8_CHABU|nr:hypothetical protein CBR_g48675 [Chara braunii]|eukprot:GBG64927.1 hypothetical protein CBR_g48675 [Chara braunii]
MFDAVRQALERSAGDNDHGKEQHNAVEVGTTRMTSSRNMFPGAGKRRRRMLAMEEKRRRMNTRDDDLQSENEGKEAWLSSPRQRVLEEDGGSMAALFVNVTDALSLLREMRDMSTGAPSKTIVLLQNVSYQGRSVLGLTLDSSTQVVLRGECGGERCVIDGGSDESRCLYYNGFNASGSLLMADLEFRNLCFEFFQPKVEIHNCVFRDSSGIRMMFHPNLTEDRSTSTKQLAIHECYFTNIQNGLILEELPATACISHSVFASGERNESVLTVRTTAFFQEKNLTVFNCTFRSATWPIGTMGPVRVESAKLTSSQGDSSPTEVPRYSLPADATQLPSYNSTVSFINCTFLKGNSWKEAVSVITNHSEPFYSILPYRNVRLCSVRFDVTDEKSADGADVAERAFDDFKTNIEICPWLGVGAREVIMLESQSTPTTTRPGTAISAMSMDRINGSSTGCKTCARLEMPVCNIVDKPDGGERRPQTQSLSPAPKPPPPQPRGNWVLPLSLTIALAVVIIVVAAGLFLRRRRPPSWIRLGDKCSRGGMESMSEEVLRMRQFTWRELKEATHNFTTVIGKGGSATVFKGTFRGTKEMVAVKSLKQDQWRNEKEFLHEVGILGRISHRNLVRLLGFCNQKGTYFLVFELVPRGTLKDHLYLKQPSLSLSDSEGKGNANDTLAAAERSCLDWPTRMRIAAEVASALEYLHHLLMPPLVHRDIKPENILLLDDFTPKVSDFGLCRKFDRTGESLETVPAGTVGYMAPEIYDGLSVTEKVDVYSYGVLVLEIVTGRRPFGGEGFSLVNWVRDVATDEKAAEAVADPQLQGNFNSTQLYLMTRLARRCVCRSAERRPTMEDVTSAMERIRQLGHQVVDEGVRQLLSALENVERESQGLNMDESDLNIPAGKYTEDTQWMSALYVPMRRG